MRARSYWDLTEKDRAALTREEVERYGDFELMQQGVLKVQPLVLEPEPVVPEPTTTFFRVGTKFGTQPDVLFTNGEDAHAFASMFKLSVDRTWTSGDTIEWAEAAKDVEVRQVKMLTRAEKDACLADLKRAGAVRTENVRRTKEYEEARKKQDAALEGMWADWLACGTKANKVARIAATRAEYETLAGDPEIAAAFLAKTFSAEDMGLLTEWGT